MFGGSAGTTSSSGSALGAGTVGDKIVSSVGKHKSLLDLVHALKKELRGSGGHHGSGSNHHGIKNSANH